MSSINSCFLIHQFVDAKRVKAIALPKSAPEQRLGVALQPDAGARRGLEFENAPDLQSRDIGKR